MKYINYKEERNHGTIDFPIEFYHVTPNHPRYDMSYHGTSNTNLFVF